jgi:hypothetical protein
MVYISVTGTGTKVSAVGMAVRQVRVICHPTPYVLPDTRRKCALQEQS